mmetsp:Transcript_78100/g.253411  ORF Transcript_78100/g.253411 Transcript_78100/m.253411 type:complete len:357 (+) Transcript_78100:1083-2153(+)
MQLMIWDVELGQRRKGRAAGIRHCDILPPAQVHAPRRRDDDGVASSMQFSDQRDRIWHRSARREVSPDPRLRDQRAVEVEAEAHPAVGLHLAAGDPADELLQACGCRHDLEEAVLHPDAHEPVVVLDHRLYEARGVQPALVGVLEQLLRRQTEVPGGLEDVGPDVRRGRDDLLLGHCADEAFGIKLDVGKSTRRHALLLEQCRGILKVEVNGGPGALWHIPNLLQHVNSMKDSGAIQGDQRHLQVSERHLTNHGEDRLHPTSRLERQDHDLDVQHRELAPDDLGEAVLPLEDRGHREVDQILMMEVEIVEQPQQHWSAHDVHQRPRQAKSSLSKCVSQPNHGNHDGKWLAASFGSR